MLVARERKEDLEQVAHECEKIGSKILPLLADVSDHEQVNRLVAQGTDKFGKIDVLMCCAGDARIRTSGRSATKNGTARSRSTCTRRSISRKRSRRE